MFFTLRFIRLMGFLLQYKIYLNVSFDYIFRDLKILIGLENKIILRILIGLCGLWGRPQPLVICHQENWKTLTIDLSYTTHIYTLYIKLG